MRIVTKILLTAVLLLFPLGLTSCSLEPEDIDVMVAVLEELAGAMPTAEPYVARQTSDLPFDYEIYFTNPSCPPVDERQGGLDELIAADIRQATQRIDIAAFDLDSLPLIDALIEVRQRGLEVRVVVDDEYNPASTTNRLRRNGISVVEDQRSTLQHNKFIVLDEQTVWTGSMNFTTNGVYCNNNNLVRISAPELAANYTLEMEEMFIDRRFGITSPVNTTPSLNLGGVEVENYFAPEDGVAANIMRHLGQAETEILFMAFSFTSNDIGDVVFERAEAGVTVRGVFENVGAGSQYSYFADLDESGLPNVTVRTDGNPRVMHHKVFVIDRETVIFGSYNFSANAEQRNDENVVIVIDPDFASYFVEEFEVVWQEAAK